VVAAGDRGAAKQVGGESKVFLEIEGLALVARVVLELQAVPEVSEVWVIGDSARLAAALGGSAVQDQLRKPLHVVEQFANLYENVWEGYRRVLPRAGAEGRDPESPEDENTAVLYLSGDLPFATAAEISDFVVRGLALGCDYAVGLSTQASLQDFLPGDDGTPGVEMASFNLREGRFRQNNLHLAKPARLGNRHYIQDVYVHRHQKELGQILALAWTLLTTERGGLAVVWYYGLMHLAGLADRRGWRRVADAVRRLAPLARIERCGSDLLKTDLRFVVSDVGGCAVDIDNDADYAVAKQRFHAWRAAQRGRAEQLAGAASRSDG
ncbi:MAG: NTP transferase domain-containing protein, partial [Deltaproteobacteria bacterium]|nr:NTP transferase domain-containing protein [Deltaproteobacteria bacterium]